MNTDQQSGNITEIAIYKFDPDVNDAQALEYAQSVGKFLKSNDGFISRSCSKAEDGQWVDVILWESMEKVQAAMVKAPNDPDCKIFFSKTEQQNSTFLLAEEQFAN